MRDKTHYPTRRILIKQVKKLLMFTGGRSSSKIAANSVKISAEATSPLSAPPPSEFSIRRQNVNTADTGKLGVNENFTMGNSQRRHWSSREGPNDLGISLFNGLQEDRAFVYTPVWFIWWERHRSLHSHDESGLSSLSAEGMIKFRNPGNNNKLWDTKWIVASGREIHWKCRRFERF